MKRSLAVTAVFVAAVSLLIGFAFGVKSPEPELSPAAEIVLRTDAILDSLSAEEKRVNAIDIELWVLEIVPWFAEEGLSVSPRYALPTYEVFRGRRANHVGGYTYCTDKVFINSRYLNHVSPWADQPALLATLVHELAHVQQGAAYCRAFSSAEVESSAQIIALEVLAAMANGGSRPALVALLDELKYMALSSLRYEARGSKEKTEQLIALQRQVFTPQERARRNQSYRFWRLNAGSEYKDILYKYGHVPFTKALDGLNFGGYVKGLVLGWDGVTYSVDPRRSSLTIDDLAYFLDHMEELVASK